MCGICRFFQTMHGCVSDPSFCVFTHRVAFEEVSGHRVLIKSVKVGGREELRGCSWGREGSSTFPSTHRREQGRSGQPTPSLCLAEGPKQVVFKECILPQLAQMCGDPFPGLCSLLPGSSVRQLGERSKFLLEPFGFSCEIIHMPREIGVFRHVAPTRGYVSNFFVRLASS